MTVPPLVADLSRPEAYPDPRPARVTLVTTHISWVFLTDREVWKVKRPVDYGFLDYTTAERRRECCEAEVRLNRRLAPDVYREVAPVHLGPAGHAFRPPGAVVDHAVRMRRLPDDTGADALLRRGALGAEELGRLAVRLASFYAEVPATPRYGALDVIQENVQENFAQTAPFVGRFVSRSTFDGVQAWQTSFLAREAARFRERVADGRIREGHGDLRLEHVYFDPDMRASGRRGAGAPPPGPRDPEYGQPILIDAIEFNERFRMLDVAADVAFLAMELTARSRPDLAEVFLARFARESGDYDLYGVVDFYTSYRAWVRAKVTAFLAADAATPPEKAERKGQDAAALFELARRYGEPPPVAAPVIAIGGLIGSGKSTLAAALADRLAVPVIDSDRTRKALAGVAATARASEAAYTPAFTERTFAELFRRAEVTLASGRGVVLDATFRGRDLRRRARQLARRCRRPFLFVETVCDEPTVRERLRRRAGGPSTSDATEALLEQFRRDFEPVTELPPEEWLRVDTTEPLEAQLRRVDAALTGASGVAPSGPA